MNLDFRQKLELWTVRLFKRILNIVLRVCQAILFPRKAKSPKKILVFKVGNIGDIICAIPSFIAVRKNYPGADITLLTSPGERGIPGAAELLAGAWYLDKIIGYDAGELSSFAGIVRLIRKLRRERFDILVHLPADSWTNFRTLLRNMIFARLLGVRSAFGFRVRTIINIFKKTQIDCTIGRREADTLLDILREAGVKAGEAEFDLPIPSEAEEKARNILDEKWGAKRPKILVAVQFGTKKNFPEKRWFPERFSEVLEYLIREYGACAVIMGGPADTEEANLIARNLKKENILVTAGKLTVIESAALLKQCSFLLSIDSGLMHIMAAFKKPTVAIFSTMNILGLWFPYGSEHEIIYHRNLDCDYRKRECVQRGMSLVTADEVERACDRTIKKLGLA